MALNLFFFIAGPTTNHAANAQELVMGTEAVLSKPCDLLLTETEAACAQRGLALKFFCLVKLYDDMHHWLNEAIAGGWKDWYTETVAAFRQGMLDPHLPIGSAKSVGEGVVRLMEGKRAFFLWFIRMCGQQAIHPQDTP